MRVLVIGRTGQLARALALMSAPGIELTFLGREACDLARPARIAGVLAAHAPDAVINAAAYTAVDRAESEPGAAHLINATAVGGIARACAATGAALVHVSTDYVFDGAKPGAYRETDPTGPLNVYGASKLAGEVAALAACERTVILRTAWVYSPWGRNFVTTMVRLAETQPRLRVVADQRGTPTSALDLAAACLAGTRATGVAPAGAPAFGLYHYAGSQPCSWAEFARGVLAAAHRRLGTPVPAIEPIGARDYPGPARRPANSVLDCARFEAAFGLSCAPWGHSLGAVLDLIGETQRPRAVGSCTTAATGATA